MSHISVKGEASTLDEIAALRSLAALSASGSGQFIRKTSLTTFENATPAGGSSGGGTWGSITGTLSAQADLQAALNAKVASTRTVSTAGLLSGGGDLSANRTITTSIATNKLVGRSTAGTGVFEAISIGTGLSLSGGTLSATAGAAVYVLDASNNIRSSNAGAIVSGSFNFINGYLAAGNGTSTGDYNVFDGVASGYYNTTGGNNSFFGAYAGYTNSTGNYNIAIGVGALLYSGTGSRQLNIGNLIWGTGIQDTSASGATNDVIQEAKFGLGIRQPLVRAHVIGEYATIPDPVGFTAYLGIEIALTAAPSDNPVLVYQPVAPTSSGFGYDAVQGPSGPGNYIANGQTINATVYSGRTIGGQDEIDPVGFPLTFTDLINDGITPFTLTWYYTITNNADGSAPDFFIFVNSTTGFVYKITPGSMNFFYDTDTDPGSVPTYVTFAGFAASGQTFSFDAVSYGPAPSNGSPYYSTTITNSTVTDIIGGGFLMQVQHNISGAGSELWKLVQTGVGGTLGNGNLTFYQDANFGGTTTVTPNHYGWLSDGSILNRSFSGTARNVTDGELYSTGSLSSSTTDPNDGQYYYIGIGYNSPKADGIRAVDNASGLYRDIMLGTSGTIYIDALGGTFAGSSPIFVPTYRSHVAVYAETTSDDTYPVAQLRLRSTNANGQQGFEMYENNTLKAYQKHLQGGNYEFMNSNGIYDFVTLSSSGPTINFKNSSGTLIAGVNGAGDLAINHITVGDGKNIILNTTTGTKIGTATGQKMAFYNSTPIAQPTGNIVTALSNLGLVGTPTMPASSVSSGAAITKTDDTNVTLTLGGSATTALIAAASLTLGWTGTLARSRGGTGQSTSPIKFTHIVDANNGTTAETDLYSDTLAAGQLGTNSDVIEAQYGGIITSVAASTQQLKVYFGGTAIFDSGALNIGVSTTYWTIYVTVIRVSSSVVRCSVTLTTSFASLSAYTAYTEVTGLTLANTQVLKITGTAAGVSGGSNQITAKEGYVEYKPVT